MARGRPKGVEKTPGSGRKRGTLNKVTLEVRETMRAITDDPEYQKKLGERVKSGKAAPAIEALVWYYAYGKPSDQLNVHAHVAGKFDHMTTEELRAQLFAMVKK